jgi:hypothetical protein
LDFNQGFERRIQIRHAQVDELGKFCEELFVELFVCLLGDFGFSFSTGELRYILVRLFDEFLDSRTDGIVVEEFVVSLLDAFVDIGEVGAKT